MTIAVLISLNLVTLSWEAFKKDSDLDYVMKWHKRMYIWMYIWINHLRRPLNTQYDSFLMLIKKIVVSPTKKLSLTKK